jgi:predicted PhzF superfamily epimerase YddE/YHI9
MQMSYQLVRVFDKPEEAQGNQAMVFFENNESNLNELIGINADLYKDNGIATKCFVSLLDSGHYKVQCFNDNKAIQCCGHGLIAAAKTIFSVTGLSSISINENVTALGLNEVGRNVVLELPRLSAHSQPVADWMSDVITLASEILSPTNAAVSDEDDGYLLLEFKPALSLDVFRTMQLDLSKICENTKRAIVVVQFDQKNEHLYTRYFAPQYGVTEDSATGSVMRFVADYIEKNYQVSSFDVSQCSALGGFMSIECQDENIKITANATIESS